VLVDVWWADVEHGPPCQPWLSAEERARVERLVMERDRRQRARSFAFTRLVLRDLLGREPELLREPDGKPYLPGREVAFNLSHSHHLAVLAVGPSELGVDVEWMGRDVEFLTLARRFFARPEWEWLDLQADPREPFYRIWTRKEAYIKALGTGLRHPLDAFCVLDGLTDLAGQALEWRLQDLELPIPDYRSALVTAGPQPVTLHRFTWPNSA